MYSTMRTQQHSHRLQSAKMRLRSFGIAYVGDTTRTRLPVNMVFIRKSEILRLDQSTCSIRLRALRQFHDWNHPNSQSHKRQESDQVSVIGDRSQGRVLERSVSFPDLITCLHSQIPRKARTHLKCRILRP